MKNVRHRRSSSAAMKNRRRRRSSSTRSGSEKDKSGPTTNKLMKTKPKVRAKNCVLDIGRYGPDAGDQDEQSRLEISVMQFRSSSHYGPEDEERTCIWRGGSFVCKVKSSGISWIGVNGTVTACVVSMSGSLDVTRLPPSCRRQLRIANLLNTVLADMGVWTDKSTPSTGFRRQLIAQSSPEEVGPFAVVSIAPGTVEEEMSRENSLAIDFLEATLKKQPSFSLKETVQTAIYALKCLLGTKFEYDKIEVWGSGDWEGGMGRMSAHEVECHVAAVELPRSFSSFHGLSSP